MKMETNVCAVILVRTAVKSGRRGPSELDSQEARCRQLAADLGAIVLAVYREDGVPGTADTNDRPQLLQAIRDIEQGDASMLIADNLSRVSRDSKALFGIVDRLDAAGGRVSTCLSGSVGYGDVLADQQFSRRPATDVAPYTRASTSARDSQHDAADSHPIG